MEEVEEELESQGGLEAPLGDSPCILLKFSQGIHPSYPISPDTSRP